MVAVGSVVGSVAADCADSDIAPAAVVPRDHSSFRLHRFAGCYCCNCYHSVLVAAVVDSADCCCFRIADFHNDWNHPMEEAEVLRVVVEAIRSGVGEVVEEGWHHRVVVEAAEVPRRRLEVEEADSSLEEAADCCWLWRGLVVPRVEPAEWLACTALVCHRVLP